MRAIVTQAHTDPINTDTNQPSTYRSLLHPSSDTELYIKYILKLILMWSIMSRVCLLLFALVCVSLTAECHLIYLANLEDVTTKEVLLPREDEVEVVSNVVDAPVDEVAGETDITDKNVLEAFDRKCAAVGQSCMNHSDCCSNSCLGYMKKCVS